MSWILTYLMIGVACLFLYDKAANYTNPEFKFTFKEQIIVGLIWPLAVISFIYHLLKEAFR